MAVLVCHCNAVNEARVREAIAAGACTEAEVAAACGAGTQCGGCAPTVCWLLQQCAASARSEEMTAGVQ